MATLPVLNAKITYNALEHKGAEGVYAIDFGWSGSTGDNLYACVSGELVSTPNWWGGTACFILKGDDGRFYGYAHCQDHISDGRVSEGQIIGHMGFQGNVVPSGVGGTHLHFSVMDSLNEWSYGGDQNDDLVDPFISVATPPSGGTSLPPSAGGGAISPQKHNYDVAQLGDIIELIPKYLTFYSLGYPQIEILLNPMVSGNKITIEQTHSERGITNYDQLILKNRFGNWLHKIDGLNGELKNGSPVNIDWTLELKNTSKKHSLLSGNSASEIMSLMKANDQVGLKNYLKKDSGWTLTSSKLVGNVKTSTEQLKHNDRMHTDSDYTTSTEIKYIPTLFSDE